MAPLEQLSTGWHLVYWRVVALDGRPSRGAFLFAVGPNPGPAPAFEIPSVEETAATPRVVVTRWLALLAALAAIGLVVLCTLAGPTRRLGAAFAVASAAALVLAPLSALFATAQFALRSVFDLGALVPLLDDSALGRGVLGFELCFALFVVAGAIALRTGRRPVAVVALALAGIALALPGLLGPEDALTVLAGGLPRVRRGPCRAAAGSGRPLHEAHARGAGGVRSLGGRCCAARTSAGRLVGHVLRQRAGCRVRAARRARRGRGRPRAREKQCTRPAMGVLLVLAGTLLASVVAAAVAHPSDPLALGASTQVGPGLVSQTVEQDGYRIELRVDPNRAGVSNRFELVITKDGAPVTDAEVQASFSMLEMEMGQQDYEFPETAPGVYGRAAPALVMVGHGLAFEIDPEAGNPFTVRFVDETTVSEGLDAGQQTALVSGAGSPLT